MYNREGELRRDEYCLDYHTLEICLVKCHGGKGNQVKITATFSSWFKFFLKVFLTCQHWEFKEDLHQLQHKVSGKCLTVKSDNKTLVMDVCDSNKDTQKWDLDRYDPSKLKAFS